MENNKETEKKKEETQEKKKTYFERYCDDNPEADECRIYED